MNDAAVELRLIDQLTTGVLTTDEQLNILEINNAAQTLFHCSTRRAAELTLDQLIPSGQELAKTGARAINNQQSFIERDMQLGDHRVDGIFSPTRKSGGAALVIELIPVAWHLDMLSVESKQLQQDTMRRMLRELSHEVKNPLGGIRGAAQLMLRSSQDQEAGQFCHVIISEADRLAALVERFGRTPERLVKQPINIHVALERVRQLSQAQADNCDIKGDYDPSIPPIEGDLDLLIQGFLNLLNNALEAEASRIILKSRIISQPQPIAGHRRRVVRVEVIDNGNGVPESIRKRLFYPLISGRSNGTGLGLSITQHIAVLHGGSLQCDSKPGKTIFSWLLPLPENGYSHG